MTGSMSICIGIGTGQELLGLRPSKIKLMGLNIKHWIGIRMIFSFHGRLFQERGIPSGFKIP